MEKEYTSSVDLTTDFFKYSPVQHKKKLINALGYKSGSGFAKLKSAKSVAKRGGGMLLRDINKVNARYIEKKGGRVKINW